MQSTSAKFIKRYLPLIFWLAFIFFASTDEFSAANTSRIIEPLVLWLLPNTSPETLATIHFLTRKAAHFTEYFILGLLAARAFYKSPNGLLNRYWLILSISLIAAYALADEYHQSFVPSRTASIYDSFIDMSGGFSAVAIWRYFKGARD